MHDSRIGSLLRRTLPPADTALRRDLWPQIQQRAREQDSPWSWVPQFAWWEWALAGVQIVVIVYAPSILPLLFYHL